MIQIPVYLAVAQWALLAALCGLVLVMFRQLGRLLGGGSPAAAAGPATGGRAARIAYIRSGERAVRQFVPGAGQPALVAFADPTCPSCEDLVSVLDQASRSGELAGLRVLVLISDPPGYLAISAAFSSAGLEIGRPAGRDGLRSYRVTATPLLVAIDADGVVRAGGPVTRAVEVAAFARACLLPDPRTTPAVAAAGPEWETV